MTDRAHQAGGLEGLDEAGRRLAVLGQRLLDQGVDPGRRQGQPDLLVVGGGHRDDAVVDAGRDQLLHRGHQRQAAGDIVGVAPGIGDRDQLDAVEAAQHPGVVTAHHAQADEPGTQGAGQLGHQAPAAASALTAVTIRSRSPWLSEGCTGSDSASAAAFSVCGRSSSSWNDGSRWLGIG